MKFCTNKNRLLIVPIGCLGIGVGISALVTGAWLLAGLLVTVASLLWTIDAAVISRVCVTQAELRATSWFGLQSTSTSLSHGFSVDVVPWGAGGVGSSAMLKAVIGWSEGEITLSPVGVYRERDIQGLIQALQAGSMSVDISPRAASLFNLPAKRQ